MKIRTKAVVTMWSLSIFKVIYSNNCLNSKIDKSFKIIPIGVTCQCLAEKPITYNALIIKLAKEISLKDCLCKEKPINGSRAILLKQVYPDMWKDFLNRVFHSYTIYKKLKLIHVSLDFNHPQDLLWFIKILLKDYNRGFDLKYKGLKDFYDKATNRTIKETHLEAINPLHYYNSNIAKQGINWIPFNTMLYPALFTEYAVIAEYLIYDAFIIQKTSELFNFTRYINCWEQAVKLSIETPFERDVEGFKNISIQQLTQLIKDFKANKQLPQKITAICNRSVLYTDATCLTLLNRILIHKIASENVRALKQFYSYNTLKQLRIIMLLTLQEIVGLDTRIQEALQVLDLDFPVQTAIINEFVFLYLLDSPNKDCFKAFVLELELTPLRIGYNFANYTDFSISLKENQLSEVILKFNSYLHVGIYSHILEKKHNQNITNDSNIIYNKYFP